MEICCGLVSLEVGAAFSAIFLLIISGAEFILQQIFFFQQEEKAAVTIHVFLLMIGAVSLLIGILLVDAVCTYLFVIFWFGTLIAKIAAVIVFATSEDNSIATKILVVLYLVILFVVHTYVMVIAAKLGMKIWRSRHQDAIMRTVRLYSFSHHSHHVIGL